MFAMRPKALSAWKQSCLHGLQRRIAFWCWLWRKKKSDHKKFELGGTNYLLFPNSQKKNCFCNVDWLYFHYLRGLVGWSGIAAPEGPQNVGCIKRLQSCRNWRRPNLFKDSCRNVNSWKDFRVNEQKRQRKWYV